METVMVKRSIGIVLNEVRNQLWNCAHLRHKGALPKGAISFLRTVLVHFFQIFLRKIL